MAIEPAAESRTGMLQEREIKKILVFNLGRAETPARGARTVATLVIYCKWG